MLRKARIMQCRDLGRNSPLINVRDPLYLLGYGIPDIYVKRIPFSSWGNVG